MEVENEYNVFYPETYLKNTKVNKMNSRKLI